MAIPSFVDQVTLHLAAGRGGNGVASVKREKFKPLGGPAGRWRPGAGEPGARGPRLARAVAGAAARRARELARADARARAAPNGGDDPRPAAVRAGAQTA